jgi:hypothetical protein
MNKKQQEFEIPVKTKGHSGVLITLIVVDFIVFIAAALINASSTSSIFSN